MSLKIRLARQFIHRLSPQEVLDLAGEAAREWMARMPVEERAALMNSLLPLVARHFPLDDVDILGTFADFESPRKPDWEGL